MDDSGWSHPDITLPQLLILIRSFIDMLILASGYQLSGLPARWRTDDVRRALRWASLLEEIMRKIPVSMKGKDSRQTLDAALQDMIVEDSLPVGIPKLSCAVLAEAKKLLIFAMSNALGSCSGQVESLLSAAYNEKKDWEAVLEHVSDRCLAISSTKALCDVLKLATLQLNRSAIGKCCQQWRQKSLSYALGRKTLYKLSGAKIIFESSESQWRNVLDTIQGIPGQADVNKTIEIAELCCLKLAAQNWSILTSKLLQACENLSCSRSLQNWWQSRNDNIQELESKKHGVEPYLQETMKGKEELWWNLPPILVAAALTKGKKEYSDFCMQNSQLEQAFATHNETEFQILIQSQRR